ncbi:hypothetical protein B4U79_03785, partial [Dinothrombium tinctorium]
FEQEIDVNAQEPFFEMSALSIASDLNEFEMVKMLMLHPRIDINIRNNLGLTPLHLAAMRGNFKIVRILLNHPLINVDAVCYKNCTPLWYAVSKGHYITVQIIADQCDLDFNLCHSMSMNILCLAFLNKFTRIVETLLQMNCKIDLNLEDEHKNSLLHFAVFGKSENEDYTEFVVNLGGKEDVNLERKIIYLLSLLFRTVKIDEKTLNRKNIHGETPLFLTAKNGYENVLKFLLKNFEPFIDLNITNIFNYSLLHIAVENNNFYCVKEILQTKIDLERKNFQELSAFEMALIEKRFKTIKIMIDSGKFNLKRFDNYGNSILHQLFFESKRTVKMSRKEKQEIIMQIFDILLKNPQVDENIVNASNKYGKTILHFAAMNNFDSVIKMLLENNYKKINPNLKDEEGNTPLHLAISFNKIESAEELLKSAK